MTNDQPIRFRTFADEDDDIMDQPAFRASATYPAGEADIPPRDAGIGATFPPADARVPQAPRGAAFLAWGIGLALAAGVATTIILLPKPGAVSADNTSSPSSLQVHRFTAPPPGRLAASALMPCYVNGAPVGPLAVDDCGRRNGVVSGRLDVGLNPPPPAPMAARSPEPQPGALQSGPTDEPLAPPVRPRPSAFGRGGALAAAPGQVFALDQRTTSAAPTYPGERSRQDVAPSRGYADDDEDRADEARIDPEESVRAARTFYDGLADADGARAASVVVREKRRQGPLSAGAIDRYYSSLQAPLRLTRLYPLDDHTVVARYTFVDRDGEVCQGSARVTTTKRDGEVYVQGVRALDGC